MKWFWHLAGLLVLGMTVFACTDRQKLPESPPTKPKPAANASARILRFSDRTFAKEVLSSDLPVLVVFCAEWAANCRMVSPTVDGLARENAGRAKVGWLNVDESPETTKTYEIKGMPTFVIFKGGTERDKIVGLTAKETLQKALEKSL